MLDGWNLKPLARSSITCKVDYSYQRLAGFHSIRLLTLFPGTDDEPLAGEIKEVPLDRASRYLALSYHWGAAKETHGVQTAEGLVAITASLNLALRDLRVGGRKLMVWVDAICINQDNSNEKTSQIRLMGEIFWRAESVVAWTGSGTDGSDRAMEALLQMRTLQLGNASSWSLHPDASVPSSTTGRARASDGQADIWEDIRSFFERPWFSRAWVVQEIVFATKITVHCGRWRLEWDDLFEALQFCVRERPEFLEDKHPKPGRQTPMAAYSVGLLRDAYRIRHARNRFRLLQLFELCSYTSATKEQDKLFSLLGLASNSRDPVFDPDYDSPFEDVMVKYAGAFVEMGQALDLLYRAGTSKSFHSPLGSRTGRAGTIRGQFRRGERRKVPIARRGIRLPMPPYTPGIDGSLW
jgi:hypothetical protein